MTPPLIDQGILREDPARSPGARDVGADVPIRFADVLASKDATADGAASVRSQLLEVVATVPPTDASERDYVTGVSDMLARVFDRDGLFGRPVGHVPPVAPASPGGSEAAIIPAGIATIPIPIPPGPVAGIFAPAPTGQSRSTASVVVASEPKSSEATAAIPTPGSAVSLSEGGPISVRMTASDPCTESPAARRSMPPAAAVAVVVHAAKQGMEIVAQRVPTAPPMGSSERDGVAGAPSTQARVFNQDGFFGRPVADVPPIGHASPGVSEAAIVRPGTATLPIPIAAGPVGGVFPLAPTGQSLSTASSAITSAPRSSEATEAVPNPSGAASPGEVRPITVGTATSEPGGKSSAARRLPHRSMPPAASVTVAVHAAARGMEVVAQAVGLDERERAALADEIAALLSAHGYPPAHISVIAAARAAHQEHR